jgi:hypothetical protein
MRGSSWSGLAATLAIKAMGRGSYGRTRLGKGRFPAQLLRAHQERVRGFRTGDVVGADVPKDARKGVPIGRGAVRETGPINIGKAQPVNWKQCQFIQRADGGFAGSGLRPDRLPPCLPATVASGGFLLRARRPGRGRLRVFTSASCRTTRSRPSPRPQWSSSWDRSCWQTAGHPNGTHRRPPPGRADG